MDQPTASMQLSALDPVRRRTGLRLTSQIVLFSAALLAILMAVGGVLGDKMSADLVSAIEAAVEREGGSEAIGAAAQAFLLEGPQTMIGVLIGIALGLLAVLALFVHWRLGRPARLLLDDVRIITAGNFDHRIPEGPRDELGELGEHLNLLTSELRRVRDELRRYNRSLERGVQERTDELNRRNAELGRAYQEKDAAFEELKTTQMQMVQQERMATLGQLLAGIAHEINNPVNYMVNAIRPLQDNVERIDALLRDHELSLDQGHAEDSISPRLGFQRVMDDIQQSVDLIRAGADRTARIVQNLRTFSRSAAGEVRDLHLGEGLDVTLSLLNHLIRGRIDVVKDYDYPGPIEGVQGELNQVFMNLLSNAAQSISGRGVIHLAIRPEREGVLVRIEDSGCGIPEANLRRVFEPFFTTKDVPIGTGLGLSISQNIVAKHGGYIQCASEVGRGTVFEVWLPATQGQRSGDAA